MQYVVSGSNTGQRRQCSCILYVYQTGSTALHMAASEGKVDACRELVMTCHAKVEAIDAVRVMLWPVTVGWRRNVNH